MTILQIYIPLILIKQWDASSGDYGCNGTLEFLGHR